MRIIGLDVETSKIPNHFPWRKGFYLSTISLNDINNKSKSWVFYHNENRKQCDYDKNFKEIQQEIDKYDVVAAHNFKFDLNVLRNKLKFKNIFCTMVAEYMINYHSNKNLALRDLALKYKLAPKLDKVKMLWDAGYDTHQVPLSTLLEYCEDDAYKARRIAEIQNNILIRMGLYRCFVLQMDWLDMLSFMECNGICWDNKKAHSIVRKYEKYGRVLESKIKKLTKPYVNGHDIKLSSNDELSCLLYGGTIFRTEKGPVIKVKNVKVQMPYIFTYKDGTKKIKVKWKSHPKTNVIRYVNRTVSYPIPGLNIPTCYVKEVSKSTDACKLYLTNKNTLKFLKTQTRLQKVIIKLLLKKSSIDKVVSTFLNTETQRGLITKIAVDGRLHTNYNQTVTATSRLSSSDPNSQNFPRGGTSPIKSCIIPEFDEIMDSDLSQIELRVPAQLSQDKEMIREFINNEDLHSNGCTQIMKLSLNKMNRFHAKTFNFRMIYGGTAFGYHKDPNMPDFGLQRWEEIVTEFYNKYKGLKKWQDDNILKVIQGDGTLTCSTGRIYKFKLGYNNKYNERQIKNYPVQGTAGGDILPLCAIIIWKGMKSRGMKSKPILTVHDSIVFDVVRSERETLADLCMKIFNNLPKYIKLYWGINWIVPITGEVEVGPNYGKTKRIR
jgi:DNA polymerase I-like protein with 3'-5' exonuclease and polymerase domains